MEPLADANYVRRVAHDTLQRGPDPRELRSTVGMPVARVARYFLRLRESMEQFVEEELYYYLLIDRFRPATRNVAELPERLSQGTVDVRAATAEIVLSPAFSLRNPGNDTFVTVVLEQCLGMTVQERRNRPTLDAGKQMYDGTRVRFLGESGQSQADLVRIVLGHVDFTTHLLDRHHRRVLRQPLVNGRRPSAEAQAWIDRVHAAPAEFFDVLGEWLASDDYVQACAAKRPRTDRQFVRSLYVDVLGRAPSYDELRNVRNALQSMADPTPLRTVVVKLVLDSGEARLPELRQGGEAGFVDACFERYLGRAPRQPERDAFAALLREPETTARHVVRALLSSTEYQFY
ncbi:MAG: hypothetical protein IPM29_00670 [Planctomycetes bacterium]|nr:hypothetical protein [Planctomycetota bacterium]